MNCLDRRPAGATGLRLVTSAVGTTLPRVWRPLIVTDLLFKAFAFVVLTPAVSLLFRLFLVASGRTVLADADIARFLLHPLGWTAVTLVGAASLAVIAVEQAALMTICVASREGRRIEATYALRFAVRHGRGILRVAVRLIARLLVVAAPFLAAGGGLYVTLLTDHDINFYLAEKPPRFWWAVVLIGGLLAVMSLMLIRRFAGWGAALPLHLFEQVESSACLAVSSERLEGRRGAVVMCMLAWLGINLAIASALSVVVLWIGRWVVPAAANNVWTLIAVLGSMLLLWIVAQLAVNVLSAISLAVILTEVYQQFARSKPPLLTEFPDGSVSRRWNWTSGRMLAAVVLAVTTAATVGAVAIHSVRLDDDIEITAHRGASNLAPENTLASIEAAIGSGADWAEVDVQESQDGIVLVVHDSDLKRVAGVGLRIWEASADELRSADIGSFFSPDFSAARVPTLAEVLDACRGRIRLNIELKSYGHDQNLEQKVAELVEAHGMEGVVVVMSMEPRMVRRMKALRPGWTVGQLTAVARGDLTRTDADFLAVSTKLATRALIRAAHARGKQVHVWTVDDPISMSTVISRGADNLITNRPELARRVLDERSTLSPIERALVELAYLVGVYPDMESRTSQRPAAK